MTLEELVKKAECGDPEAQFELGKKYLEGDGVEKDEAQAVEWYRKAAEQGYAAAQFNLGTCYESGKGIERDEAQAVEWYRKAAEQGEAQAQFNLANCYYSGCGVEEDKVKAVRWVRKAAEQGYAAAQFNLGTCYERGEGVEKDEAQAVEWYRKSAKQGDAKAQFNLGSCYYSGQGAEKNEVLAVEWYRKAAEQGHARAQTNLGFCYYSGFGVEEDKVQAVEWWRKAAEQGEAQAQFNLANCYYSGCGVEDKALAAKWLRKAAEQGLARAQFNLGTCYERGEGVEKDEVQAVEWYCKAAMQDYAEAQTNLGACYQNGIGVEKNEVLAVEWFRKAVEQGYVAAQYNLGYCYQYGIGVEKDEAQAVEWYRKAAEQGYAAAQNRLGICYEDGIGVEKSEVHAVEWYRKAAMQDYAEAQTNLGVCYKNGIGVEKNEIQAVVWCRKAAEQGFARAQFNLGVCYQFGIVGVEKDEVQAVVWYRKAAEQGLAEAQFNLGVCYQNGEGVEKDEAQAVEWYRKSAEQGLAEAQYNLGYCYYDGKGIKQDFDEAAEWFEKAVRQKMPQAQYMLGECYDYGRGVEQDLEQAAYLYEAAARQGDVMARCRLLDLTAQGIYNDTIWLEAAADEGYPEAQIVIADRSASEKQQQERQQAAEEERLGIANALYKHHVFISWNHNDIDFKNKLVDKIENYDFYAPSTEDKVHPHFRTWESDRDGEGEIDQCIKNAIGYSKCFVVLLSENSLKSDWVKKEVGYALDMVESKRWRKEDLIVVYLDEKASTAAQSADENDPISRLCKIELAAKFPHEDTERDAGSVCERIKNCLERRTCERFAKDIIEECSVYRSTIYGQITGEDHMLLKSRFAMDSAYLPPQLYDISLGKTVCPQDIMESPHSFWLYGNGGVGKSLFINYLIKNYMTGNKVFIKLDLSDVKLLSMLPAAAEEEGGESGLVKLLNEVINRHAEDDAGKSEGAFVRFAQAEKNQIFIVFDGMDELDEIKRRILNELIKAHLKAHHDKYPSEKFIFVSRSQEGMNDFNFDDDFKCYLLKGFSDPNDAEKLYDAIVKENKNYLTRFQENEIEALKKHFLDRVKRLPEAVKANPLLLSNLILIWLQSAGKNFPEKKYEILRTSVNLFMESIADSSVRVEESIRQYLRNKKMQQALFEAVSYQWLWGSVRDSETLLVDFFKNHEQKEPKVAEELACSLNKFLLRRKIFNGKAVYHDSFTAYFASAYLFQKIYEEKKGIKPNDDRIAFCKSSDESEQAGEKRLRSEMCINSNGLIKETAFDLVLTIDSKVHSYCGEEEMNAKNPSRTCVSRTLKILRQKQPEVCNDLLSSSEEMWYGKFIEAQIGRQ